MYEGLRIKTSLHRSHGDVEEGEIFFTPPSSDVQNASNIELLEYPSDNNSLQSSPAVAATHPKKSTSKEKFHVKLWACVTNLFANWWACVTNLFVDWRVRVIKSFVDWWMEELLAILLSIVALFAIVVILRKYDDQNLPKLPHNVSLNLVVSTLATFSKSWLILAVTSALGQFKWLWMFSKQRRLQDVQVFDEASRGPLGASKLLASRRSL